MARDRYFNEKYKVTLISINPIIERTKAFEYEREKFEEINSQHARKEMKKRTIERYREEIEYEKRQLQNEHIDLNSSFDKMDRHDGKILNNNQNPSLSQSTTSYK